MDPALAAAALLLVSLGSAVAAIVRYNIHRRESTLQLWREAAQAAGLGDVREIKLRNTVRLVGQWGRLTVEFGEFTQDDLPATRVWIRGLPSALTLRLETPATVSARTQGRGDLETGDPEFDDEVYLQGPADLVHAIMDANMRLRMRSMLGTGVGVRAGRLYAVVPGHYGTGAGAPLKALLPLLLEFASRLLRPSDVVQRLAANAAGDPVPGVRLRNLLTLAREYAAHPDTAGTLASALEDRDEENRLRVASLLGPQGQAVLVELASGEATGDSCAARAVSALGAHLPQERTLDILGHALRTRRLETAAACLAALGRSRSEVAVGTLGKVLAREHGALAEAAARALGASGGAAAERLLLGALSSDTPAVRAAAVEALGQCGSVAAVEPLRAAEERYAADRSLRRLARQAIAAIQARAASASPGQLTIAEGESGRLSLEDDAAGLVSLATASEGTGPAPVVRD